LQRAAALWTSSYWPELVQKTVLMSR
jgi:hypothetical protein